MWCHFGGWPFLQPEALWIDLNTFVTIQMMKHGRLVEGAVRAFAKERGLSDAGALLELVAAPSPRLPHDRPRGDAGPALDDLPSHRLETPAVDPRLR